MTNCFLALKEDGLLTAQSETPTFKKELKTMKSIYKKMNMVFPIVKMFTAYIPSYTIGIWCFAFCSKKYDPLINFQKNRYKKLSKKNRYYNNNDQDAFCLSRVCQSLHEGFPCFFDMFISRIKIKYDFLSALH